MRGRDYYLYNGLGAGNIGDEAMLEGWLQLHPLRPDDLVEVDGPFSAAVTFRHPEVSFVSPEPESARRGRLEGAGRALLLGDTPVTDQLGLDWPLRYHAPALAACAEAGVPVHAVGVGVDRLSDPEGVKIFRAHHSRIASWTVRTNSCRAALEASGVSPSAIRVAADLAWLLTPRPEDVLWASEHLRRLGLDLARPLVGVSLVNEIWGTDPERPARLARLLARVGEETGAHVLLVCNETRPGPYFDSACAQAVAARLPGGATILPPEPLAPSQMAGVLRCCSFVLAQRYHVALLAMLAGVPAAVFARGQKVAGLAEDAGTPIIGDVAATDPDGAAGAAVRAFFSAEELAARQRVAAAAAGMKALYTGSFAGHVAPARPQLATLDELISGPFRAFMRKLNAFAAVFGLREMHTQSKVWEYPWIWFHALLPEPWEGRTVVDVGSELSPMPWLLALLGAEVTLVEATDEHVPAWERVREALGVKVTWRIIRGDELPLPDGSQDGVTSFSTIRNRPDKRRAIDEVARILKPGGLFALSFDVCEEGMGMAFPAWNGKALTFAEFEEIVWAHPGFSVAGPPAWNLDDVPAFLNWHRTTAPHHNYVVGAAALKRRT
jgi:polysaccharide pyruvyl transferase WcaK-like protein/SAM-dependent methyltransferase